jgi:hypothetical protein
MATLLKVLNNLADIKSAGGVALRLRTQAGSSPINGSLTICARTFAAAHDLGISARQERGRWKNSRVENSHQPIRRRERKMQRFKSSGSAQRFLSAHAAVFNTFKVQRHLTSASTHRIFRAVAMSTWRETATAA